MGVPVFTALQKQHSQLRRAVQPLPILACAVARGSTVRQLQRNAISHTSGDPSGARETEDERSLATHFP